jgi:hypothetical protein
MNREESRNRAKNFSDKFLIVGYKPNGQRGIPVIHEWVTKTAIDENEVCEKTKGLIEFKVFLIEEGPFSFTQWINLRASKSQEAIEKEEKALYEQLKSKFEPK